MYVKVKRAIRCIIFCVAIAVVTPSSAINGVLYDSGRLASSLIKQAHQDKYGFVWTTTEFGLSKFDGYHFTNYYHSSIDTISILDNNVTSIASTTRGELYIGCNKGHLAFRMPRWRVVNFYSRLRHRGSVSQGYWLISFVARKGKSSAGAV